MKRGVCATLTLKELQEDITPNLLELMKLMLKDYIDGTDDTLERFKGILNNSPKNREEVIQYWCDRCSEQFFEQHLEIDDVFLLVDDGEMSGVVQKEFLASRENSACDTTCKSPVSV